MADVRLRDLNPAEFNYGVNVAGSLGVGTTSPAYNLHIKPGTGNADFALEKASAVSIHLQANSTTGKIGTISNHPLLFTANNAEKMRLLTTGHFGLGTGSAVLTKLHVRGNSDTSDHDCAIRIVDADGTTGSVIPNLQFWTDSQQIYQIRANDSMGLQFRNSSDATKVTFDDDGKVGIGETEPAYQLHVNSGSTGTVAQFKSTGTTAKIMFNNSGSNACFLGSQNNNLFFQTNSTNRMFISTAGNVGIGTTNPGRLLELSADTNGTVNLFRLTNADSTYSQTVDFSLDTNKDLVIAGGSGNGGIHFNMGSRGYFFSNGKVGIGTTSPEETLHVNGNLKVTGSVDVGSSGFSVSSGFIIAFAGTAPSGWLECNGQAVSRSTYSDLFAIVGVTFGAGDGSTTFNVPDLQGRVMMGEGGNTAGRTPADLESVADAGGSQTHTLTKGEIPGHVHPILTNSSPATTTTSCNSDDGNCYTRHPNFRGGRGLVDGGSGSNGGFGVRGDLMQQNTPADGAHNNIQPSLVVRYLIKT